MAPFLVILLLLALGAGIVAWHTLGYPHVPGGRRPMATDTPRDADAPAAAATEPIFAPASDPFSPPSARADDPFAHAPRLDMEHRP